MSPLNQKSVENGKALGGVTATSPGKAMIGILGQSGTMIQGNGFVTGLAATLQGTVDHNVYEDKAKEQFEG